MEGKAQHARVDAKATKLPTPDEAAEAEIHSRSVTLSSERLRVIAKLDLLEGAAGGCWRGCWTGRLESIRCSSHGRGLASGWVGAETA